jgi:hypothetical protein
LILPLPLGISTSRISIIRRMSWSVAGSAMTISEFVRGSGMIFTAAASPPPGGTAAPPAAGAGPRRAGAGAARAFSATAWRRSFDTASADANWMRMISSTDSWVSTSKADRISWSRSMLL